MDKIILRRPQSVAQPNLPHKSVFLVPRDFKSHIYGPRGPHQSPKTAKNTFFTAAFSLVLLLMVKPFCVGFNVYLNPLLPKTLSHPSQGTVSQASWLAWSPTKPRNSQKQRLFQHFLLHVKLNNVMNLSKCC